MEKVMEGEEEKVPRPPPTPPLPVAGLTLEVKLGDEEVDRVRDGLGDIDTDPDAPLERVPPLAKVTEETAVKLEEGIGVEVTVAPPFPKVGLAEGEKLPPPPNAAVNVGSEDGVSFPGEEVAECEEEGVEV